LIYSTKLIFIDFFVINRPSCDALFRAFKEGVEGFRGNLINYGLLSTPQLHFMVYNLNNNSQATEDAYFNKIATAFNNLMSLYNNNNVMLN
jgi:phosphoacetylglucosamine mutase